MIENTGKSIIFYAQFIAAKVGKTALTVTIDVWQIERDGSATEIVTAGSATEVGDGVYRYLLADSSVDEPGEYVGIFKTADSSVDQQHIPAIWFVERGGTANLDAAVSTRLAADSYTAPPSSATNATAVRSELATELSRIDATVSSRLASDSYTAPDATAIEAAASAALVAYDAATATDVTSAISGLSIPTATQIADGVLSRGVAHVEDVAEEGSLAELLLGAFESATVGTTWIIRKTGGDAFNTRTLTTDANAEPVTGVTDA